MRVVGILPHYASASVLVKEISRRRILAQFQELVFITLVVKEEGTI
jgi:hypothetical protein